MYVIEDSKTMRHHLNWMLYGLPGSGKTAAAATLQAHQDTQQVLFLSVEGGMLTLKDDDAWRDYGAPQVIKIDGLATLEEVYWALMKDSDEFKDIQTIVIDSLTELGSKDLEATVTRNLGKKTRSGKQRQNVDDAWLEDRGEVSTRQARIVRGFRDMPRNFIATAHPRITYQKDNEGMPKMDAPPVKVEPGFGDRLRQHLCGYCDFVWYLQESSGDYIDILTRTRGVYYAKSRNAAWNHIGEAIRWPKGTPLLADVWRTIIGGESFPVMYKREEEN